VLIQFLLGPLPIELGYITTSEFPLDRQLLREQPVVATVDV